MSLAAGRLRTCAAVALAGLSLAACSTLPANGPDTSAIAKGADERAGTIPYVLVDLNEANARAIGAATAIDPDARTSPGLPKGKPVGLIGPGDGLRVVLWEPDPSGHVLFTTPGLDLQLRVDVDGSITLPYVGRVAASGRAPARVEAEIRAVLASQGHDMQASVVVTEDDTNFVMVQGDVSRPGRYPIAPSARGLLDVVALAGGARGPNQSATVRVTRNDDTVEAPMSSVVGNRRLDVRLSPGDRVLVLPRSRSFYAFGAVNRTGEQPYDMAEISMARTLARISGLSDDKANPSGVFVYRRQDPALTRRVVGAALRPDQDPTQVVYRLDLRDPKGFFVSQAFRILPEDIVYVSEAPLAEATKVMQLVSGIANLAATPRAIAQ